MAAVTAGWPEVLSFMVPCPCGWGETHSLPSCKMASQETSTP
jgi:hypothetical protein